MSLTLITPPTAAALTTAEAKLHVRVSGSAEDLLIDAMIAAATQEAEHLMQRAILPQTWRLTLDEWPCGASQIVHLPMGKVTAVSSVRYAAADTGTMTPLTFATDYQADLSSDLTARLLPAYGKTWPATRLQLAAVEVTFVAGWPDAASVPPLIKSWLLLRVGALYENRQAWTEGRSINRNGFVDGLLDRYRRVTL